MKHFLLLFLAIFSANILSSQNLEWAIDFPGGSNVNYDEIEVVVDNANNLYTIGSFTSTADMDPSAAVSNLTASGTSDIFIQKLDEHHNFLWASKFSGFGGDVASAIVVDDTSNIYIAGVFNSNIFYNYGNNTTFSESTNGSDDIVICKLDPFGNLIWGRTFGSPGFESISSMAIDSKGNLYCTGYFSSNINFDGRILSSQANENGFLVKLDNSGNTVWAKSMLSANSLFPDRVVVASDNEIYTVGNFFAASDLDLDPLTVENIVPVGSSDAFVLKCDSLGNRTWVNILENTSYASINDIDIDSNLDIILCVYFTGTIDPVPSASVINFTTTGQSDILVVKYSSAGFYIWGKQIEGSGSDVLRGNHLDSDDGMYMTGEYTATMDLNPGLGVNNVTSNGGKDIFFIHLDKDANFIWGNSIGSSTDDIGRDIEIDTAGNIYATNNYSNDLTLAFGNDSILLNSNNQDRIFTYKLSKDSCKSLTILVDSLLDVSCEQDTGYVFFHSEGGTSPYSYYLNNTQQSSTAIALFNNGIHTVEVRDSAQCVSSTDVLVNKSSLPNDYDLDINMMSTVFQPGFFTLSIVDIVNLGCDPISGNIVFEHDSLFEFEDAFPFPDQIMGDSLIWNYVNINFDSLNQGVYILSKTSLNAVIGDTMDFILSVNPLANDFNPNNNNKAYQYEIVNSYDPNDKSVYPQGACAENFVQKDDELTYTFRFQNTGNYKATNIFILDTLSQDLDLSSLKVTAASHAHYTEIVNGNVLKFSFDNINLPDSSSNEIESHGYIVFKIKMKNTILENTVVQNRVGIYFDFNLPIITNYTKNTAVSSLPNCLFTSVYNPSENKIALYPNPASDVLFVELVKNRKELDYVLYSVTGEAVLHGHLENLSEFSIPLPSMVSGVYFLQIKGKSFSQTTKVVIEK